MNTVSPAGSVRFAPRTFTLQNMSIRSPDELHFGRAPHPITYGWGVVAGAGTTFPVIKFIPGETEIKDSTWPQIKTMYQETTDAVCKRALELDVPYLHVDFETPSEMTQNSRWGLEITKIIADILREHHEKYGLKSALQLTPTDIRDLSASDDIENHRISRRNGPRWEEMLKIFTGAADAGAHLIGIESTGAKEIADFYLLRADLTKLLFMLGVLAPRDMAFLWSNIVDICNQTSIIPSGDSACAIANVAMTAAEQRGTPPENYIPRRGFLPRVYSALVRLMTIPRALVAFEKGAIGTGKDCEYVNPYMQVIAGVPIVTEGKSATPAHISPMGNITMAWADGWSNEAIKMEGKLMATTGPVANLESLAYDCHLMNAALASGQQLILRDLLVSSDAFRDPQAFILHPEVVLELSRKILEGQTPFERTQIALLEGARMIKAAVNDERKLRITGSEIKLLDRYLALAEELRALKEEEFIAQMLADQQIKQKVPGFVPAEYGLE